MARVAHVERRSAGCRDLRATVLQRESVDGYGYLDSYACLRRRVVLLRPVTTAEPVELPRQPQPTGSVSAAIRSSS